MEHKTYDQLRESLMDSISYVSDMKTHEMLFMSDPAMALFGLQNHEEYRGRKCY